MDQWPKARKLDVLERMLVIRRFEESLVHLFEQHAFMAHYHLYIGQEATGVAVLETLRPGDKLATTHRNHGHVLGRGADPARAMAEILCRTTGLCNGYGGTLHLTEPDLGFLHTSSIVGGCIGLATGAAFALKKEGGEAIAVAFFGDGSLEEGISYEAMNFAALWSLPILYVCENNSRGALGSVKGGFPTSVSAVKDLTSMPQVLRHAGRERRRAQPRRGVRGGEPPRRSRAQAQRAGLPACGDRALGRLEAAVAGAADRRHRHHHGVGREQDRRRARRLVPQPRSDSHLCAQAPEGRRRDAATRSRRSTAR